MLWAESTHVCVDDAVIVCVIVTGITQPVSVCVLLPGVWNEHAVVLETARHTAVHAARSQPGGDYRRKQVPGCTFGLCTGASGQDNHQCLYPYHTYSHYRPSQSRTNTHTHTIFKVNLQRCTLGSSLHAYHTADAAVSLHDALAVGIAGTGLSVGAEPEVLATFDLVAGEAGFTVSTAEGALGETTQSEEYERSN